MKKNYKKTMLACYLGFITQAISVNFAPLLFLMFHKKYDIPLGKIALIPTTLFFTQLLVDLFCAKFADRIGYRKSIVLSEICSAAGLIGLAVLPEVMKTPFAGILLSTLIYAIGSGLIEVLCSPIVEACPFENKDAAMSLLHSFYCWGSVGVIAISTLFFAVFSMEQWRWLACIWALVPLYNVYNFLTCPIEPLVEEGQSMRVRELLKVPVFWIAIVLMVCAGASELSMSQWASAFAESAIGLNKNFGDLAGPCLFAVMMGISRSIYGKFGARLNLMRFMTYSAVLCLVCYLLAALSSNPVMGLIGCVVCGFSVGIMWPGAISISSVHLPTGGTAMFALLAMAGDLGGTFGPGLVGTITQHANDDLQAGMLVGCVFPVVLLLSLAALKGILQARALREKAEKLQ